MSASRGPARAAARAGETLRVGIVGAGWMGVTHGRAWSENAPRGRIVAVADVSAARGQAISDRFAGSQASVYPDLPALLGDGQVDAVDICLPHHLHKEAIVTAARAGKHVLCEKPLCLSLDEANAIRAAVGEAGVVFMAAHNNLFAPALMEARRLLADGALGTVQFVRSTEAGRNTNMKTGQPPAALAPGESSWSWRLDPAKAGGGEVLDTGWHGAYRLLALAGSRPVEVSAMLGDFYLGLAGVEDTGALLVRFESGAIGFLFTSWAFGDPPGSFQYQAGGERGTLGGTATKLVIAPHGQPAEERAFEPANTFAGEVRPLPRRGAARYAGAGHVGARRPEPPVDPGRLPRRRRAPHRHAARGPHDLVAPPALGRVAEAGQSRCPRTPRPCSAGS